MRAFARVLSCVRKRVSVRVCVRVYTYVRLRISVCVCVCVCVWARDRISRLRMSFSQSLRSSSPSTRPNACHKLPRFRPPHPASL